MSYRGIIVDNSLEDTTLVAAVKTLAVRHSAADGATWTMRLVTVSEDQINHFVSLASDLIKPGWYMHFYNNQYLIVIFKDRVFRFLISDKRSWQAAVSYGKNIGIKAEQLDFWPHAHQQEQSWLSI